MALYHFIIVWALLLASCYSAAIPSAASNSSNYFAITGTHTGTHGPSGPRPARRNILDLQNDRPSWSLYIQALNKMQSADENYYLSYFQIAGIHGRPYYSWNDAPQAANAFSTGYCTHSSVLFLTWHRPYLALYEQILSSYAQDLVASYPSNLQSTYQTAADNLRLAYWDWATIPQLPAIVEQPTVTITTGTGIQNVNNPLYQYKFQNFPLDPTYFPTSGVGDSFLAADPETLRGVVNQGGSSNPELVDQYLANQGLMRQTWLALVKSTTFDNFSTTATEGTSIENVHNQIHVIIGLGFGHMSYLSYSAFDPIFWLHHANVDRLYAMWQAANPNSFLTPLYDEYGTFTIPPGTTESVSTPLEPFSMSTNGPWYTSTSSRSTATFGYTYPEIDDWNKTAAQLKNDVRASINQLYNPKNAFSRQSRTPKSKMERRTQQPARTREWFVTLSVSKFDLQGQHFTVVIFLGSVPSDSSKWQIASNSVGVFPIFPPPPPPTASGGYPNITAYSEYSLEDGLKAKGVDTQNVHGVKKYLKENLAWGVMKFDGTIVPTSQLPSLSISVTDEMVTLPTDNTQLPIYGPKTNHDDITEGKTGGSS